MQACSAPAPPATTRGNSRGSSPRSTVISRTPCAMLVLMTRYMPAAACSTSRSSGCAMRVSMALRAAAGSSSEAPAGEELGIEVAEHQVGVGAGGLLSRRARSRPGPDPRRRRPGPCAGARPRRSTRCFPRPRRSSRSPAWATRCAAARSHPRCASRQRRRAPARRRSWSRPCRPGCSRPPRAGVGRRARTAGRAAQQRRGGLAFASLPAARRRRWTA